MDEEEGAILEKELAKDESVEDGLTEDEQQLWSRFVVKFLVTVISLLDIALCIMNNPP